MKKLTQKDFKPLFSNLCCSRCRNDFTINSVHEIERCGDLLICTLTCEKCLKEFGEVIINFNRKAENHTPLEPIEGPDAITIDDVIDAHRFIKENL